MELLIVDDDERFRERLSKAFTDRGVQASLADGIKSARLKASSLYRPEILLDLRMPGISGLNGLLELRSLFPDSKIVVLTGYGSIATAVEALKLGAYNYLTKPIDPDSILDVFNNRAAPNPEISPAKKPLTLEQIEWEHISHVLERCQGNVSNAAKLLGMHRRSLQRKLAKNQVYKAN